MPEYNENDVQPLTDALDDLDNAKVVALFEIVAGLDPLDLDEGKAKYTADQQTVIHEMQREYRLAGFAND